MFPRRRRAVAVEAEHDLGGAVPARHHVFRVGAALVRGLFRFGEGLVVVGVVAGVGAREPKVADLEGARLDVDDEVGGLEVPVQHLSGVL